MQLAIDTVFDKDIATATTFQSKPETYVPSYSILNSYDSQLAIRNLFEDLDEINEIMDTQRALNSTPLILIDTNGEVSKMKVQVDQIIKNGPATIVKWRDGTKTIVKRMEGDPDDPYMAFCAALAKKVYGSSSAVSKMIARKTVDQDKKAKK